MTKARYDGDVIMNHDGRLCGMMAGDVIVRPGCTVGISGMDAGDVYVEAGAYAQISGMVRPDRQPPRRNSGQRDGRWLGRSARH